MFTRFVTPRPRRAAPLAGTFVSVTAHAALLGVAVGGDLLDRRDGPASSGTTSAARGGEGIHWVGTVPDEATVRPPKPGARLPIAYVVPGRGALRTGTPGPAGPRAKSPGTGVTEAADPPPDRRPPVRRAREPRQIALPLLPAVADVDVAILVPGIVSSAPDLARVAARPDDFVRRERLAGEGGPLDAPGIRMAALQQAGGPVDLLPIALVGNPLPSYPAALARARVSGHVLVEFRVDSAGAVDLGSLRVLQSTDALFTRAVQAVLPALRFLPAQLGRQSVGVTVRQPFAFTMRSGA